MEQFIDIIPTIARQRGRGDTSPLLLLRQLDGAPGERISHLPVDSELEQAWVALTGEPFRPHQAQALTAFRRGEPVALLAADPNVVMTAYLLLYATLPPAPETMALVLVPDDAAAQAVRARLEQINQDLPRALNLAVTLVEAERRPDYYARIVIATTATLHSRLLRHHDRAWQLFWSRLRMVVLPDLQRYAGVAGAHLSCLLPRLQRIAAAHAGGHTPNLVGTLFDIAEAEPALLALLGQPWRVVAADDGQQAATTFAVWRGANSHLREAAEVAATIRKYGYQVHIACGRIECASLAPFVGDLPGVTFGPEAPAGVQALITVGFPGSHSALRRMLRSGYQAVVLIFGDLPHEQALARHVDSLLSDPSTRWPPAPLNAYVAAQHILCAATEQPLTEAEVEAWGTREIVNWLAGHGQLVDLPDDEAAWKPTHAADDPYAEFSLLASSGGAIVARGDSGPLIALLDPTNFERWTFPGAALPPGAGGFRVMARDEDAGSITLRHESNGRRTYPLRRCEVTLREERETRALSGGRQIGWGRVFVSEEIYGYRESAAANPPVDLALKPALTARWTATACWFTLAIDVQAPGQLIGWCLAAALPLRALASFTDIVPCYDHETRRLYLVDAQPGGSGLAAWIYTQAEELLPLAYDVALACRSDALLEPLSRADMDWLLAILGGRPGGMLAVERPQPTAPAWVQARPTPAPSRQSPVVSRRDRNEGERALPPPSAADERPAPLRSAPIKPVSAAREQPADTKGAASNPPPPVHQPPPAANSAAAWLDEPMTPPQRQTPHTERRAEHPKRHAVPPRPAAQPQPRADNQAPPPGEQARSSTTPADRRKPPAIHPHQANLPGVEPPQPQNTAGRPGSAAPPDDEQPNAAALIERLRRQRRQREANQPPPARHDDRHANAPSLRSPQPGEPRFKAGERIFCLPYGDGVVRTSRIEDGRELLTVAFPDHGELTINPAVSLVRKLEDAPPPDDDLL